MKFIGPSGEVISKMGDKDAARRLMKANHVPTTPGTDILLDAAEAQAAAEKIGYPVLIKASAGGGGKGIRLVERPEDMERAFETASAEAEKAFGDGRMYMEKYLDPVKHIEVQLLADEAGHIVCLGERECSIQRNNQKLIEESPSPGGGARRPGKKLMDTAARAARAAGYVNAGTVEFLMDKDRNFYFMEMNTRLQVEHPVSELVTGADIVKWQIRIAAGVALDFAQEDIQVQGAAIECRINALGAGKVDFFHIPGRALGAVRHLPVPGVRDPPLLRLHAGEDDRVLLHPGGGHPQDAVGPVRAGGRRGTQNNIEEPDRDHPGRAL